MELDVNKKAYIEEATELLTKLEESLLELEENPEDLDIIAQVFRAMHTIKGSGAMFEFDNIADFTHDIETFYDLVRNGKVQINKSVIDLSLAAKDQIKAMLDEAVYGIPVSDELNQKIIQAFKGLIPDLSSPEFREEEIIASPVTNKVYRIRFTPDEDMLLNGTNPIYLLEELQELGECKVYNNIENIPDFEEMDPVKSYIQWDIILAGQVSREDIEDVFIFVDDSAKITIEVIDEDSDILSEEEYKPLGKILSERGDISEEDIDNALREQKPVGEILINKGVVSKEKITSALEEQKTIRELRARRNQEETTSNIRVSSDKLDKLINLVGEIVIAQARLSQYAANKNQPELEYIAEEVERLTIELRDSTLNIRMVPIETSFSKFKRLVRDLSRDLNKEINLYTFGGDTELDKNVIEKLNDPLVHLIRNSIDHGLETPEERVAKGKPRAGCIELSAFQSGADVMIEIRDDGQGLDEKAIFNKAVQKQLISPDAELSRKEIFSLILQPGFSTSSKVTNISGRGVGMDVVKKCIDQLKGNIIIESEKGRGTIITLKLPLTLAIIEGLLVKINDSFYVIPLYSVEECVELTKRDIKNSNGRHLIEVREELVPYVRLREYFDFSKERPPIEQIVITNHNNHRIGLVVDEVVGEHQTVVKTLGTVYKNINSISGATILGDGTVALILDIVNLIREAEYEELDWIKNTFNGVK